MRKVQTAELSGVTLDWAVAKAVGFDVHVDDFGPLFPWWKNKKFAPCIGTTRFRVDWKLTERMIYKFWVSLTAVRDDVTKTVHWRASTELLPYDAVGPNPLVAAWRLYVMYKLGPEVDIPDRLLGPEAATE